ncbi:MAG: PorT family protein [Rikenellaceae bacterium]
MRPITTILVLLLILLAPSATNAQNVIGVSGGIGSGSESIYPIVEGKSIYGLYNFGISWRTYSEKISIGGFGIDLEFMQRGFSLSPNASLAEPGEELYYYRRDINTLMMPIVWQPHVYVFDRRARLFFEAAATFHYDLSSTYTNEYIRNRYPDDKDMVWEGEYEYMVVRDNRFGYGLAGGVGLSVLVGKYEFTIRGRYYYDYSDVVRNRTKYYSNNYDGNENPFYLTPVRSPLRNVTVNFGVSYHIGPEGFKSWNTKRVKFEKSKDGFNYDYEK